MPPEPSPAAPASPQTSQAGPEFKTGEALKAQADVNAATSASPPPWDRKVGRNFAAVLLLLASFSVWAYLYIDSPSVLWGSLVANFLYLLNAFVQLLPSTRGKFFTRFFDRKVMRYEKTWLWVCLLGVGFFLYAVSHGSIELISTDGQDRWAKFYLQEEGAAERLVKQEAVPAQKKTKYLLRAGILEPRVYRVQVTKLPTVIQPLSYFGKPPLVIPDSFGQRAVLAYPLAWLGNTARRHRLDLRVTIQCTDESDPRIFNSTNYQGELIWIGGRSDLAIPEHAMTTLKAELADPTKIDTPLAVEPDLILEPNDRILIEILSEGKPYAKGNVTVPERTFQLVAIE